MTTPVGCCYPARGCWREPLDTSPLPVEGPRAKHDVIVSAVKASARGEVGVVTSAGQAIRLQVLDLPTLPPTATAPSLAGGAPISEFVDLDRGREGLRAGISYPPVRVWHSVPPSELSKESGLTNPQTRTVGTSSRSRTETRWLASAPCRPGRRSWSLSPPRMLSYFISPSDHGSTSGSRSRGGGRSATEWRIDRSVLRSRRCGRRVHGSHGGR